MSTEAQIAANRENARNSTGPVTPEGKAASSQNNFRHGFRSKFRVLTEVGEEQAGFDELITGLREEHQPSTLTEHMLVDRMAEHFWLSWRARQFQDGNFHRHDEPSLLKALAIYIRYENTHERAFHKCLSDLQKLRAERRKGEIGFERQKQAAAEEVRKQEAHEAKVKLANAKSAAIELDTAIKEMIQAPLPGYTPFTFDELKPVISHAIAQFAAQKHSKAAA